MDGNISINPRGFDRGFRPLGGDNNPPPTPTQQEQQHQHGGRVFQTLSAPSTVGTQACSAGVEGLKRRRRLPGPLAFFQQGETGTAPGAQDAEESGGSDEEGNGGTARRNKSPDGDRGEVGGGHFSKGPWLSLCSAVDVPIPEEGASDVEAVQTYLDGAVAPMADVLAGDFDLRVPVIMAVIDSLTKLSQSDVVVDLVDPSGRMRGYLHPGCMEDHGPDLAAGAALLLKEVSIFVTGPGTTRLLNIHPSCVMGVYPADTGIPSPERLQWLRNCDPPFTPRSPTAMEDGDHPPTRLSSPPVTPPLTLTASTPKTTVSPRRRRPRPVNNGGGKGGAAGRPARPPPPARSPHREPATDRGYNSSDEDDLAIVIQARGSFHPGGAAGVDIVGTQENSGSQGSIDANRRTQRAGSSGRDNSGPKDALGSIDVPPSIGSDSHCRETGVASQEPVFSDSSRMPSQLSPTQRVSSGTAMERMSSSPVPSGIMGDDLTQAEIALGQGDTTMGGVAPGNESCGGGNAGGGEERTGLESIVGGEKCDDFGADGGDNDAEGKSCSGEHARKTSAPEDLGVRNQRRAAIGSGYEDGVVRSGTRGHRGVCGSSQNALQRNPSTTGPSPHIRSSAMGDRWMTSTVAGAPSRAAGEGERSPARSTIFSETEPQRSSPSFSPHCRPLRADSSPGENGVVAPPAAGAIGTTERPAGSNDRQNHGEASSISGGGRSHRDGCARKTEVVSKRPPAPGFSTSIWSDLAGLDSDDDGSEDHDPNPNPAGVGMRDNGRGTSTTQLLGEQGAPNASDVWPLADRSTKEGQAASKRSHSPSVASSKSAGAQLGTFYPTSSDGAKKARMTDNDPLDGPEREKLLPQHPSGVVAAGHRRSQEGLQFAGRADTVDSATINSSSGVLSCGSGVSLFRLATGDGGGGIGMADDILDAALEESD